MGSQILFFKFILSAFRAEIRSCPLPESRMNLRSLACTGSEMHIRFLDFLRDPSTSCSTSSSKKTKSSLSLSNLISISNFGPIIILTSSTSRWKSGVGHDDSFGSCPSLTKSAVRFGLIIYQVFDLPENVGLVGITIDSFGHSLRVILDGNLVDFRFQVERDLASIGRLLCAGYPRRGIILCIFSVAIKEGVNSDGNRFLLLVFVAGSFRGC